MNAPGEMKPSHILLALVAFATLCAGLMAVIPAKGILVGKYKLNFLSLSQFFNPPAVKPQLDITAYLDSLERADSLARLQNDSAITHYLERSLSRTSIQFRDNNPRALIEFFEAMNEAKSNGLALHVLHYGDSQIEGDRMTGYLREKWQSKYGGYGPGLLHVIPVAPHSAVSLSQSSNWQRYSAYGFDDGDINHDRFGPLASVARFTPENVLNTADTATAWFEIRPSRMAQSHARTFHKAVLYLDDVVSQCTIQVSVNDSVLYSDILEPCSGLVKRVYAFAETPAQLRFHFSATRSPNVLGLSLQSGAGVYVDNIALRGSNGSIFRKLNLELLTEIASDLNVELVILQFGGNSVPYLESENHARACGQNFRSQIRYLRSAMPRASFLVIGPSDMSVASDTGYVTWPWLPELNNALKEAALEESCGYWDMFAVMGGSGSMAQWVNNEPPYAISDYTHFTPLGARRMAELLYKALDDEYQAWNKAREKMKTAPPDSSFKAKQNMKTLKHSK